MKHRPRIISHRSLLDRIVGENDPTEYPDFIDADGEIRNPASVGWYILDWPEHCVTSHHLGDATIHGPYATEEIAQSEWPNAM